MVIALATKPGINGANTLSIPKEWDASWFRKFIANSLKGADVRNSIGVNGISVTGTIASPYATITLGGTGGVIGNTTTPAPTAIQPASLTINGATGLVLQDPTDPILYFSVTGAGANLKYTRMYTSASAFHLDFLTDNFGTAFPILTVTRAAGGPVAYSLGTAATTTSVSFTGTAALTITGQGNTAGAQVDMAPDTGTFTGTITGCTTSPTGTIVWSKMGNLVTLFLTAISGTSNSTSLTMTGLPAVIQPTRSQNLISLVQDNSTVVVGVAEVVAGSGTVVFFRDILATGVISSTGFTASGTKGTDNCAVTYLLN